MLPVRLRLPSGGVNRTRLEQLVFKPFRRHEPFGRYGQDLVPPQHLHLVLVNDRVAVGVQAQDFVVVRVPTPVPRTWMVVNLAHAVAVIQRIRRAVIVGQIAHNNVVRGESSDDLGVFPVVEIDREFEFDLVAQRGIDNGREVGVTADHESSSELKTH